MPLLIGGICKSSSFDTHCTRFFPSTFSILRLHFLVEVVRYAARGISHGQARNPTIAPYIISTLLLLVAPALFAASIYMFLGRIIVSVDAEAHSPINTRWLTKVIMTSDVVSFFYYPTCWYVVLNPISPLFVISFCNRSRFVETLRQLHIGARLMSSTTVSTAKRGSHIVSVELLIQILIFSFFVDIIMVLLRGLRANTTCQSHDSFCSGRSFCTYCVLQARLSCFV